MTGDLAVQQPPVPVCESPTVSTPANERPWTDRLPGITRIVSHVVVWSCLLAPVIIELTKGWVPVGDNAAIAIRAHQSLSLHPPWVGMYTTAGSGLTHTLYDPGPLLFWLLAIPVHLDPVRGALWGSALLGGAVLSVAVEAVWRTRAWIGCAVIAFVVVDLLWLTPEVLEDLVWNAYFPVPFLVATLALAWVVARGGWGWWPTLVLVASVAAQCHLIFVIPCVALAVLAPAGGWVLSGRPPRWRWLGIGLVVGLACWLAPLLQNVGSQGNLSALLSSGQGQKRVGLSYALQMLATAASPDPIWLTKEPLTFFPVGALIGKHAAVYGVFALVVLAGIAVGAWRTARRSLSALAGVALVAAVGIVCAFAIFPLKNAFSVDYLIICLWVLGILCWTVMLWTLWVVVGTAVRRRTGRAPAAGDGVDQPSLSPRSSAWLFAASTGMVVVVGVAAFSALASFEPSGDVTGWGPSETTTIDNLAAAIEHTVPRGAVLVSIKADPADEFTALWESEGVAYRLQMDGWTPGLIGTGEAFTGLSPVRHAPRLFITLDGSKVASVARTR